MAREKATHFIALGLQPWTLERISCRFTIV